MRGSSLSPRARDRARRALRDHRAARQGRHGGRLQGPRPPARRDGRAQSTALRRRPPERAALHLRDQAGAQGAAPQRLRHPRVSRGRRAALHHDGADRGCRPAQDPEGARRPSDAGGVRRGGADRPRPRGDPRSRDRAPGPQDFEPDAGRPGFRPADGFRHRERARRPGGHGADGGGPDRRHARVHEPRAGAGAAGRQPQRSLRPRHRRVRAVHGRGAVPRPDSRLHALQARPRASAARRAARGGDPARAAPHPAQGPGEGTRRSVRHGEGDGRRPGGGTRPHPAGDAGVASRARPASRGDRDLAWRRPPPRRGDDCRPGNRHRPGGSGHACGGCPPPWPSLVARARDPCGRAAATGPRRLPRICASPGPRLVPPAGPPLTTSTPRPATPLPPAAEVGSAPVTPTSPPRAEAAPRAHTEAAIVFVPGTTTFRRRRR